MNNIELRDEVFEQKEINLLDYWIIIWKRRWLIIAFTLVLIAIVGFKTFTTIPIYLARGTLLIEKDPNILTFEEIFQIEALSDDYYQTQYKLLQSRSLAANAIERLNVYENPEFMGKPEKRKKPVNKTDPALRRRLVDAFLGRLEVRPVRQTRLVEVRFKAQSPKMAADGVNALFDSFIDMNIETKYAATEQATEFLTKQIGDLRLEIEKKEKELQAYGVEKNIIALSDKETTIIEKLGELNKALTEAQIDRVKKEAYYNEIKNASPDYMPEALTNPVIQRWREEYVRLSREYLKKQDIFKPDYPEMQRLNTDLESAKKALETETQNLIKVAYADYQAAIKKEKSLEEVFNRQKQESIRLNSNAILYNSLKIEVDNKKNLLENLLTRQSETGVSARLKGLRTSNIKVVDRAETPNSPFSPRKTNNMVLALIIGFLGGLGLAFLFEYIDNSVKNSADVEKTSRLPTLGIIPTFSPDGWGRGYGYYWYGYGHRKKLKKSSSAAQAANPNPSGEVKDKPPELKTINLITYFSPKSTFSESYRSIRTAVLLSSANPNLKTIIITSPLPAEGKTATICNLAVTLAQANKKVLVIDSDLRKPRLHRIFRIKNLNGLTNYLTSHVEMKDLVKATQIPNLYFINSGPIPPNPAELLGSEKMENLVELLKQSFDHILFDTPPILVVTDAMVLGPEMDGVILVVWGGKTSKEALKRAKEKLDLTKIKVLGVILNHLDLRKHEYYYKRHYYHYYGSYYGETLDKLQ